MKKEVQPNYFKFLEEMNSGMLDQKNFDINYELDRLFTLEEEFKDTICDTKRKGHAVYLDFIEFITKVECNILAARVFFREREETFSKIPELIRNKKVKELSKFAINYKFMSWALQHSDVPKKKRLEEVFNEAVEIRKRIVEQSLPLIINRSRIYQSKTKKFNQDVLDFIQNATEGFMAAIDKFVYTKKGSFNGVAIGRMQAKFIEDSTDGMLKLTVKDKRILYRANLAIYRLGYKDIDKIYSFVKESFPGVEKSVLEKIIASSEHIGPIEKVTDGKLEILIKKSVDNVEDGIIENDQHRRLYEAIGELLFIEQKVIRLKGNI